MFEPVNDLICITYVYAPTSSCLRWRYELTTRNCRLLKGSRNEWWLEFLLIIRAGKDIGTIKYDSKTLQRKIRILRVNRHRHYYEVPLMTKERNLGYATGICGSVTPTTQDNFESKLVLWVTRGAEEAMDNMSNRVPRWFWHCGSGESDNQ